MFCPEGESDDGELTFSNRLCAMKRGLMVVWLPPMNGLRHAAFRGPLRILSAHRHKLTFIDRIRDTLLPPLPMRNRLVVFSNRNLEFFLTSPQCRGVPAN
jgi:hypothetical protein